MKSRNNYWKAILLITFAFSSGSNFAQTSSKPNLLFIITDQQRYDAMSIAGNTVLKTPNLDRLAKQGARFK
ncbi:MAG: sulfatase-like hydrolase/transferase, partial [Flavobacterium sp.]